MSCCVLLPYSLNLSTSAKVMFGLWNNTFASSPALLYIDRRKYTIIVQRKNAKKKVELIALDKEKKINKTDCNLYISIRVTYYPCNVCTNELPGMAVDWLCSTSIFLFNPSDPSLIFFLSFPRLHSGFLIALTPIHKVISWP